MKFPVDLEKIIEISDPIYTFNEIMDKVDLRKYLVAEGSKVGRPENVNVKMYKSFNIKMYNSFNVKCPSH